MRVSSSRDLTLPGVALGAQDVLEEVGVAGVFARRRRLRDCAVEIGHGQQPQLGRKRW